MNISNLDFEQVLFMCQLSLTHNEFLEFRNYTKLVDKFYDELIGICDENIDPIFGIYNDELTLVDDFAEEPLLLIDALKNASSSNSNYIVIKFGMKNG